MINISSYTEFETLCHEGTVDFLVYQNVSRSGKYVVSVFFMLKNNIE